MVRVRARGETAHEGRIYLSSWGRHPHRSSELMRNTGTRSTGLAGVLRHSGAHGVAGDAWMTHAGRMPSEVWAHTCCHHLWSCVLSTIHSVDIDKRPGED